MSSFQLFFISIVSLSAVTLAGGCHYFSDKFGQEKMIPNPLPDSFPYELSGKVYKIWIGNEMQIKSDKHMSYVLLQGVDNPDTGDQREDAAVAQLYSLTGDGEIRIVVHARDRFERAIGQVYVGDRNINLEMIRSGWARFDGSDFELADDFERAQRDAQQAKRGVWADRNLD